MSRTLLFALVLLSPISLYGQPSGSALSGCRAAVSAFYAWYVPLTTNSDKASFPIALRDRSAAFSPALLLALNDDASTQDKAVNGIAGIDFDPFVGSQDPADHYDIRNVRLKGNRCFAEIWRDSPKDRFPEPKMPDAIAELSQVRGTWRFDNFFYPEVNANLVETLALLKTERRAK